ncbi:prepilin-type N-terminal cleavage/methylation domain-containing protein [Pseudomonadota bacterium]
MKHFQNGFSMIEVLISMAVMSMGLLAVATFQADLITESSTNKARSEAIAIAQAHLDELRNYTDGVSLLNSTTPVTTEAEFNTLYADTVGAVNFQSNGTPLVISGTNAQFTPTYQISSTTGPARNITVIVSWPLRDNTTESVTLDTHIGWSSPSAVGDLANNTPETLIPSPTGRAYLGEGTIARDDITVSTTVSSNTDNTKTINDGTGDLKLIVDDGTANAQTVVLTLEDACVTDPCSDFVKISGRVYIDKTLQSINPGVLHLKASDAAYCQRYYIDPGTGNSITVTSVTTDTPDTTNSDYEYFDYTCYLGGGWHGNIGLLKTAGIGPNDQACIGDPNGASYDQPIITIRRAYRAMVYKVDTSVTAPYPPIVNGTTGITIYYSAGIADGTTLTGHDYVFTGMSGNPTDADCFTVSAPMTRTDSNVSGTAGDLFASMPDDFYCLNTVTSHVDDKLYDFNDTANTGYAIDNTCPYNPTNQPDAFNTIGGSVTISSDASGHESIIGTNLTLNTSDAVGNCTSPLVFTYDGGTDEYTANYSCNVFRTTTSTWSGHIQADYTKSNINDPGLTCTSSPLINFTGVQTNLTGQDFSGCTIGVNRSISGNIVVTSAAINPTGHEADLASIISIDATDFGDNCTIGSFTYTTDVGPGFYTAAYECIVLDSGSGWTGDITLSATAQNNKDVECSSYTTSHSSITADTTGQHFNTCNLLIISTILVEGSAPSSVSNKSLASGIITPTGGSDVSCTVTDEGGDDRSFVCSTTFTTSTWSGEVTLTSEGGSQICYGGTDHGTSMPITFTNAVPGTYTYNVDIMQNNATCP